MSKSPYRAFVNKDPEYHKRIRRRLSSFYASVLRMLTSWQESIPQDPIQHAVYRMLYEPNDVATVDRAALLKLAINKLNAVIHCGQANHYCKSTAFCPECLSFWRYKVASAIHQARQLNPKIRLVCRQETILMPRGVYMDQYDNNHLKLLINRRINPVYELPVGTKRSPYWVWKFLDDSSEFTRNSEATSERYWDCFNVVWNTIAGSSLVENPVTIDNYQKWSDEDKKAYRQRRQDNTTRIDTDIKKGISDSIKHPVLAELRSRMFRLNNIFKNSMGSVQRIMIAPSTLNIATTLLRIDSIFLDTMDNYKYLEGNYEELGRQKNFDAIDWPGYQGGLQVWHPRSKSVTFCKSISNNLSEILGFIESRFPCSCLGYYRLLTEEFPFYLNCFAEKHSTRITGFFREE